MSFMRDHLHNFVYPNLLSMYYGWDKTKPLSDLQTQDWELAKLLLNDKKKLEEAGYFERGLLKCERLCTGNCSCYSDNYKGTRAHCNKFKTYNLIHDCLDSIEKQIKPWQKLILPGRDCWQFYVCGMKRKRLKNRMVYLPQISRSTAINQSIGWNDNGLDRTFTTTHPTIDLLISSGVRNDDFFFDTGFHGSVLIGLVQLFNQYCAKTPKEQITQLQGRLLSSASSAYPPLLNTNNYREAVICIENSWKYHHSARLDAVYDLTCTSPEHNKLATSMNSKTCWYCRKKTTGWRINQPVKDRKENFLCCARMTLDLWNH